MKIKHEHIRIAMNAWAYPDGEKVPAAEIARAYFELGMTFPELYDDSHPEALARNTQKIFRWVEKDTSDAIEKIQALLFVVYLVRLRPVVMSGSLIAGYFHQSRRIAYGVRHRRRLLTRH